MTEYQTPAIFQDSDEDTIHERMLNALPEDIDKSEGSIVWDLTRPTAKEVARFKGFDMDFAIQMIFPQFATDEILDYHGEARGLTRKAAISATGELTVTGEPGTIIETGDLFATESIGDQASISYKVVESYIIPESGTITITVECTEAGTIGNVKSNSIILQETYNDGIESVTNAIGFTNGAAEESDEAYRERILLVDQNSNYSCVGSISDYKKWASEIEEVGSVRVIPAQDDSGTVTLIITDRNGNPASEEICTKVYNHIICPDDPENRKTTINGVNLVVSTPQTVKLNISAIVELQTGSIDTVKNAFIEALKIYFSESIDDKEIRYTKVCNILGSVSGVYDYKNVLINGDTQNIALPDNQYFSVDENSITLTQGIV